MDRKNLVELREALGFTQAKMAASIGLGIRAYSAIETGESPLRLMHWLAAERVALSAAVQAGEPMKAPASVRADALDIAAMIRGGKG